MNEGHEALIIGFPAFNVRRVATVVMRAVN